jgi:hypothetical protein
LREDTLINTDFKKRAFAFLQFLAPLSFKVKVNVKVDVDVDVALTLTLTFTFTFPGADGKQGEPRFKIRELICLRPSLREEIMLLDLQSHDRHGYALRRVECQEGEKADLHCPPEGCRNSSQIIEI